MTPSNPFSDLRNAARQTREFCPWVQAMDIASYVHTIADEAREVVEASEAGDHAALRDELGDVLWNVAIVAQMAEERGLFSLEDAAASVVDKMRRRKPHVFERRNVTIEEARRVWREAKARE